MSVCVYACVGVWCVGMIIVLIGLVVVVVAVVHLLAQLVCFALGECLISWAFAGFWFLLTGLTCCLPLSLSHSPSLLSKAIAF